MKKVLSALFLIFLSMSSLSYAFSSPCGCKQRNTDLCSNFKGSFVGLRPSSLTFPDPILDQYIFNTDGTLYYNQSTAIGLPFVNGTFLPFVGTWKCKGNIIKLTVVSAVAIPTVAGDDLSLSVWNRLTEKLRIINKNKVLVLHRVNREIPLNENPLTAEGVVVLDSNEEFFLRRVKVKSTDL